ncbi:hypothetical protein BX600DRAFT_368082, partial [Xylariales sp. PMI_506]
LIPGRGDPIPQAVVIISQTTGKVIYVGSANVPTEFTDAPRTHVRYLLPGLWDCHAHFTGTKKVEYEAILQTHPASVGAANARVFYDLVMAGFTSIREVGGFGIETSQAVKAGLIIGPNVYSSGAAIGITGGNCDCPALPADWVYSRQKPSFTEAWPGHVGMATADGVEECRLCVRQQIRRGADCIKIVASGGIMSANDDPYYRQYSDEELAVMVSEARLQGRAVAVHAHGKAGILAALRAGAHTIEHGSYLDEEAVELMRDRGATLVATRAIFEVGLRNLDAWGPSSAKKLVAAAGYHLEAYRTAVRKGVKIALGSDLASADPDSPSYCAKNGIELKL